MPYVLSQTIYDDPPAAFRSQRGQDDGLDDEARVALDQ
jgi:hypothetical protein